MNVRYMVSHMLSLLTTAIYGQRISIVLEGGKLQRGFAVKFVAQHTEARDTLGFVPCPSHILSLAPSGRKEVYGSEVCVPEFQGRRLAQRFYERAE